MNPLADQAERDRFVTQHGRNISVIAPAGVGKTHAIVERIVSLARLPEPEAKQRLAHLIVVTYSVRAAQEMQQRARNAIRGAGVSAAINRAFQQTFFGTIHSYCVLLLEHFGHYLGLSSPMGLLQGDDDVWERFLLRGVAGTDFGEARFQDLFHFYTPKKLYALGRQVSPGPVLPVEACPELDLTAILRYDPTALHPNTRRAVVEAQAKLGRWQESWVRGDRFLPLPKAPGGKAAEFIDLWTQSFTPWHRWLQRNSLAFGRQVANAYEAFRLGEGRMTYDDQVRLALRVLQFPEVQAELARDRLSVLLDEAQDTDFRQFEVLLRVAGLRSETEQLVEQSFCIVGDFQQAIWAPRSDLAFYQRIHEEVSAEPRGTVSQLQVTFRCDRAIIDFVNSIFPSLLNAENGQAKFVKLKARHDAGRGQVIRWSCPPRPADPSGRPARADDYARHEAQFLAREIARRGITGLGAARWQDVAILCPRKDWLLDLKRELQLAGVPAQLHSSDEKQMDSSARAWLTSLVWISAHPEDAFEVAGVLREIFGISDHEMAVFTQGSGDKLRLDRSGAQAEGALPTALSALRQVVENADQLPLHLAVRQLVEGTQLRARLLSIHDEHPDLLEQELDDFLAFIFQRGTRGVTLAELASELRLALGQTSQMDEEVRDAVQLLTSHKAKGLEWQTVIVPYLFRSIGIKSLPYPRIILLEDGEETVFRDEIQYTAGAKDFVTRREQQQLQRLLYVVCTRARHTLILIDDESLFRHARRQGLGSAAESLRLLSGSNLEHWENLSDSPVESTAPIPVSTPVAFPLGLPILSALDFVPARQHAELISKRVTPHALAFHPAHDAEPELELEKEEDRPSSINRPGVRYGIWWHEFVEAIPWERPLETWQNSFEVALSISPDPERAKKDWSLFRDSDLCRWLRTPGRVIHAELPFLWPESNRHCLEGIMDLTVFTPRENNWHVIDWKTNRVNKANAAGLLDIYREQILAYVRAVNAILKIEVRGSIYLTATGQWIDVR